MDVILILSIAVLVIFLGLIRLVYLARNSGKLPTKKRQSPCKTVIVVGSGGHSFEMMKLLSGLDLDLYYPRIYIVARNDLMSRKKIQEFEQSFQQLTIWSIMRAREVGQSYFTSIITTLIGFFHSIFLMFISRPDLVMCNGPGTCIPICLAAFLLKFFALKDVKIVYVESWCRVKTLSLSANILYRLYIADDIIVHWPQLKEKYSRTNYIGKII